MTFGVRAGLLGRRLVAYAIDCSLLLVVLASVQTALVLTGLHPFVNSRFELPVQPSPGDLHLWVFACTTLPFAAYFAAGFSNKAGATFGQRMSGIRLLGSGQALGMGRALVRAIVLLLPFELNHTVMFRFGPWAGGSETGFAFGIAAVWLLCLTYLALPLTRRDGRGPHDLAAGSRVETVKARTIRFL